MANIHVYKGTVTVGGTDGTQVSEGTGLQPISIGPLNATNNEESVITTLAVRCDTGFATTGDTVITPVGTTSAKWALSADGTTWSAYGANLTISSAIDATNKLFYVKAKATSDESPANDTTVDIQVTAQIVAA